MTCGSRCGCACVPKLNDAYFVDQAAFLCQLLPSTGYTLSSSLTPPRWWRRTPQRVGDRRVTFAKWGEESELSTAVAVRGQGPGWRCIGATRDSEHACAMHRSRQSVRATRTYVLPPGLTPPTGVGSLSHPTKRERCAISIDQHDGRRGSRETREAAVAGSVRGRGSTQMAGGRVGFRSCCMAESGQVEDKKLSLFPCVVFSVILCFFRFLHPL